MLVGGVIVDDRMDLLTLGDLRVDLIEEADELLMPMALHIAADDGAVENVERGEQCRRAVALVVVRPRPGAPRLHARAAAYSPQSLRVDLVVVSDPSR